jgi:hypothetical protein
MTLRSYRSRTNIVQDEKGDAVADCHSILSRWRNHFSELLNAQGVNDVMWTEIQTAEPLVPEPSAFKFETATEKLKDTNHQVLIKFQQNSLKYEVEKFALRLIKFLILYGIRGNCMRSGKADYCYVL